MRLAGLLLTVMLTGCSFAKEGSKSTATTLNVTEVNRKLSSEQLNILAAVRRDDHDALLFELKRVRSSDLDFRGALETPMSLALGHGNLQIIKTLFDKNVDPFNLGSGQDRLRKLFLLNRKISVLMALKYEEVPTRPAVNDGERYFLEKLAEVFHNIAVEAKEGLANGKIAIERAGMPCDFLIAGLIQQVQLDDTDGGQAVIGLLKNIQCQESVEVLMARDLYEVELKRQFIKKFTAPDLMVYIAGLKNLGTTMLNIDDSGIWVAPSLLYRIAHENFDAFCRYAEPLGAKCPADYSNYFGGSDYFMEKIGMPKEEFELIQIKQGRIIGSYRLFPKQEELGRVDPFFRKVDFYMRGYLQGRYEEKDDGSGERVFVEERIDWDVGLQRSRRMYSPSEEHDFAFVIDKQLEEYLENRGYQKGEDGKYRRAGEQAFEPRLPPPPISEDEDHGESAEDSPDDSSVEGSGTDSGGGHGVIDDLPMPL